MTPKGLVRRNELKPKAMLLWLREPLPHRRHRLVESAECKLHAKRREINRHCIRRLRLRREVPCSQRYLASGAQAFDSNYRAVYCTPSKPPSVESEAVRQSIHEREGGYPDSRGCADLPRLRALLSSVCQESSATRFGLD